MEADIGCDRRLSEILRGKQGRGLVIAIDHGLFMGPVAGARVLRDTAAAVLEQTPHAIQLTPGGILRCASLLRTASTALIYRLDTTNVWRSSPLPPAPGYWAAIGTPADALRCGASAAVAFLLGGWQNDEMERDNLCKVAQWSAECRDLGLPLMLEPLPLSGKIVASSDGTLVRTLARMATEIGCDLLKVDFDGDSAAFLELIVDAEVPVMVRGGPKVGDRAQYVAFLRTALQHGARGLVIGRNAFEGIDIAESISELTALVDDVS